MTTSLQTITFPPLLKPKGTVGIVSPARCPLPEWIDKTKAFLHAHGYQVEVHAQNYLQHGQLAGTDAARAEAIMDMFVDKTIDAILCARGGTGSIQLLDKLDYKLIRQNPKPFIGFSDITLLLNAITKECGFVTYHGPMGWSFGNEHDVRTEHDFLLAIGETSLRHLSMDYADVYVARAGMAEGPLVGGNMTLLQNLMGTPYDWSAKDSILFIEDVESVVYQLVAMAKQFHLAGRFKNVRAVLVGEMVDIADGETGFVREGEKPYGVSFRQALMDLLPQDIPVCFDFPCGHGAYLTTLPLGAPVHVSLDATGAHLSYMQMGHGG